MRLLSCSLLRNLLSDRAIAFEVLESFGLSTFCLVSMNEYHKLLLLQIYLETWRMPNPQEHCL